MQGQSSPRPATAGEILAICGRLEDRAILDIIATGASAAEVLEAHTWLMADDQLSAELHRRPSGRVGLVCDILAAEEEVEEE
ncbi:MAG TPA: hypothetical protein VJ770_22135 [Stellaceae bacterium]|jgi:hypothetical protein|nr:hypothetical protein [Stellaceae bacterium]